jgi:hypothetical protein
MIARDRFWFLIMLSFWFLFVPPRLTAQTCCFAFLCVSASWRLGVLAVKMLGALAVKCLTGIVAFLELRPNDYNACL